MKTYSNARIAFICLVTLRSAFADADTIIYPGTFDPFHNTHFAEAQEASRLKANAKVVVMPVERAYYAEAGGQEFPKLLPHSLRVQLIGQLNQINPLFSSSAILENIPQNVFASLSNAVRQTGDPKTHILVGTDVLKTWSELPGFAEFARSHSILVSVDPAAPETTASLKSEFANVSTIQFFDAKAQGLRAGAIKANLLTNPKSAYEAMPKPLADYVNRDTRLLSKAYGSLYDRLYNFLRNDFDARLTPEIRKNPALSQVLQNNLQRIEIKSLAVESVILPRHAPNLAKALGLSGPASEAFVRNWDAFAQTTPAAQFRTRNQNALNFATSIRTKLWADNSASSPWTAPCAELGMRAVVGL